MFKRKKQLWDTAYIAKPNFYTDQNGSIFGAFALTENTTTILPNNPQRNYQVDGKSVTDWRLVFVSTTEDAILFELNYFEAFTCLEEYIIDHDSKSTLIKGLSFEEIRSINHN